MPTYEEASADIDAVEHQSARLRRILATLRTLTDRALRVPYEKRLRLAWEVAREATEEARELVQALVDLECTLDGLPSLETKMTDPELKADERRPRQGSLEREVAELNSMMDGDEA